ncbi:MAG: MBL fold metallo-hydrolase [Bacillota bacterium]
MATAANRRTFPIARDVVGIDLLFQGRPNLIASFVLIGPGGRFVIIEPGPESTLDGLKAGLAEAGLSLQRLEGVLVTHIHLDHAGAAGQLSREAACPVWVHETGLPHLADPSRLWASASRTFGADLMEQLWKGITPVPKELLRGIGEHAALEFFGHTVEALYTPGHAAHHVAYLLDGELLFAGDAAGVAPPGRSYVRVPAMPPELDVEQWDETTRRLRSLGLRKLVFTHFGPASGPPEGYLESVSRQLEAWSEAVLAGLKAGASDEELARRLQALEVSAAAAHGVDARELEAYELITPIRLIVKGYQRYWQKVHPERLDLTPA